jgi:DeoR/GlpR family transcriptional regulator of sugar metabolism
MLKKERQAFILHRINLHNKVLSAQLSTEIDVSEDTVRRDLQELSDEGKVYKVHGGALSLSYNQVPNSTSNVYALKEKKLIAQKAVSLIKDGMFVLTGGGTTIVEMARALPKHIKATFITGSIPAIVEYMHHPNIEIIVIGDKLSKNSKITVGSNAINTINQLKPDLCFLGVNSIDMENGVTDNDWEIVQLKQEMIASSKKLVCLTISEKLNTHQPIQICGLNKVDSLITELNPANDIFSSYKNTGITIY